jgi:hypothetical protein
MKKRYFIYLILGLLTGMIMYYAVNPLKSPIWTGFQYLVKSEQGFSYRTLWDWLDLLIIPLVLVIGGWLLASADKEAAQKTEQSNQRQNILNSFIEKISSFVLVEDFRNPKKNSEIIQIARALITSTFRQLDPERKSEALQVIYELHLIDKGPIINLFGVDFDKINLERAPILGAEIKGAYFRKACLKNANLQGSIFLGSDFSRADFRGANLKHTDLSETTLDGANFSSCDLRLTNIGSLKSCLSANFRCAKLTDEQKISLNFLKFKRIK